MTDIEKVISGLDAHLHGCCDKCPYDYDFDCIGVEALLQDALELLKVQQPRVLTLDEAIEECWYESKHGSRGYAMLEYVDETCVGIKLIGMKYPAYRLTNTYGKYWRCWNKRPTEEEREKAKWDG